MVMSCFLAAAANVSQHGIPPDWVRTRTRPQRESMMSPGRTPSPPDSPRSQASLVHVASVHVHVSCWD